MTPDISTLDYRKLDNLIHSRIRLALMSILARVDDISFFDLKKALDASDGNLSTHLSKLENAGYIAVCKAVEGSKSESRYKLTQKGLEAFAQYIIHLEKFVG